MKLDSSCSIVVFFFPIDPSPQAPSARQPMNNRDKPGEGFLLTLGRFLKLLGAAYPNTLLYYNCTTGEACIGQQNQRNSNLKPVLYSIARMYLERMAFRSHPTCHLPPNIKHQPLARCATPTDTYIYITCNIVNCNAPPVPKITNNHKP